MCSFIDFIRFDCTRLGFLCVCTCVADCLHCSLRIRSSVQTQPRASRRSIIDSASGPIESLVPAWLNHEPQLPPDRLGCLVRILPCALRPCMSIREATHPHACTLILSSESYRFIFLAREALTDGKARRQRSDCHCPALGPICSPYPVHRLQLQ